MLLAEHDDERLREKIFFYLENISDIMIAVDGNDLLDLGYEEGPIISKALDIIKRQVLKGKLKTREKQLEYAKKLKKKLERK